MFKALRIVGASSLVAERKVEKIKKNHKEKGKKKRKKEWNCYFPR